MLLALLVLLFFILSVADRFLMVWFGTYAPLWQWAVPGYGFVHWIRAWRDSYPRYHEPKRYELYLNGTAKNYKDGGLV